MHHVQCHDMSRMAHVPCVEHHLLSRLRNGHEDRQALYIEHVINIK
jgi:hypothetical protein